MKRKIKNSIFILSIMSLLAFSIFLFSPVTSKTIPAEFTTGGAMGFDLSPGKISFGKIIPGFSSTRNITVTNNYNYPVSASVSSSGEISEYIIISDNNFHLNPNESREVILSCYPEEGLELKEFTGNIKVETKRIIF